MNLQDRDTKRLPTLKLTESVKSNGVKANKAAPIDHDEDTDHGDGHHQVAREAVEKAAAAPLDVADDAQVEAFGQPGRKRKPKLRGWVKLLLLVLFVGAAAVATRMYLVGMHYEKTDDAFVEGHVIQISPRVAGHVARVLVDDNQRVKAGDVLVQLDSRDMQAQLDQASAGVDEARAALRQAEVRMEVTSVTAHAGFAEASAGTNAAQSQLQSAQAQLATNENRVLQSQAEIRTAQASVSQARSELAVAQADAERLAGDAKRAAALYSSKTISREEYEHTIDAAKAAAAKVTAANDQVTAAQTRVAQAEAAQKAAQTTVDQYKSMVGAARATVNQSQAHEQSADVAEQEVAAATAQLETARADLKAAEAKLEQAKLQMSYTRVIASSDGQVTKRTVEAGNFVQTGQALMALVPDDKWVVANFKETQLRYMNPGDEASLKIDSNGRELKAKVDSIQSGTGSRFSLLPAENATGNFVKVVQRVPVKLVFAEPVPQNTFLAPGLSVEAKVRVR